MKYGTDRFQEMYDEDVNAFQKGGYVSEWTRYLSELAIEWPEGMPGGTVPQTDSYDEENQAA
jgi:hypothetical protein